MKSKGDPKRKPRAALANPADPLEVGTDREALIGAKAELRPCRFEMRPVDAEGLADDQRLGHLPALSPRIIPAAVGIVLVNLSPFCPRLGLRCEPENNSPFVQYMSRRLWM